MDGFVRNAAADFDCDQTIGDADQAVKGGNHIKIGIEVSQARTPPISASDALQLVGSSPAPEDQDSG